MSAINPFTAAAAVLRPQQPTRFTDVHLRRGRAAAYTGRDLEQLLVSAVVLCGDQLYRKLDLCGVCRRRLLDRRVRLDHVPAASARRVAAGRRRAALGPILAASIKLRGGPVMTSTAKLFMHGRTQAVQLPRDFCFEGTEVRVSKVGDKVILEPIKPPPFDVEA